MDSTRGPWIGVALLVGVAYAAIGILFALPASHVKYWRLAAWLVSAILFAIHIGYEQFTRREIPWRASGHVSLAAAVGAFGLAVGANVHSLVLPSVPVHRALLMAALGLWPIITAVPAFLVALLATSVLARVAGRRP